MGLLYVLALWPGLAIAHNLASQQGEAEALAHMERTLAIEFDAQEMPSLTIAIVRGSQLVYAHSFGNADQAARRPANPDTLYRVGSLTKPITATLAMALAEDGLIDLDAPISDYLPGFSAHPAEFWNGELTPQAVTTRHLLTHTSGLPRLPPNLVAVGRDPFGGYPAEALRDTLGNLTLELPPGFYFSYSNMGYALVGQIIEAVTGDSFANVLQRRLLGPLGIKQASLQRPPDELRTVGYRITDPILAEQHWDMGALAPAAGLYMSASELARFLALHLDTMSSGTAPLSQKSVQAMRKNHVEAQASNFGMGLGWFHSKAPGDIDLYWHTGILAGHFSYMAIAPAHNIGVIALTNRRRDFDPLGDWLARRAVAIYGNHAEASAGEN